jgi:uncharacterized protein YukJ
MPIKSYSVLKCTPLQYGIGAGHAPKGKPKQGDHPHFQVLVEGKKGSLHRVAINIVSDDAKDVTSASMIRLKYFDKFTLPGLTSQLTSTVIKAGFNPLKSASGNAALDFVRLKGLVNTADMKEMPFMQTGPDNDIQDLLQNIFDAAINGGHTLYAFGAAWTDNTQVFFANENGGIHDIHCNQGNPKKGGHSRDNGVWQDGGILVFDPSKSQWKAVFMAFDSQFTGDTIQTDDNGNQVQDHITTAAKAKTKKKPKKKSTKKNKR